MVPLKLYDGSTIAVIGGGPAGSFFALSALRLAKKLSRKITVVIFEQKNFSDKGPQGCNKCAGVIQNNLVKSLKEIGIEIEDDLIQQKISGYTFWVKGTSASIRQESESPIVTVFRGGGPPGSETANNGFDGYILHKAVERGATHIGKTVKEIQWNKETDSPVTILYGEDCSLQVDLVVGAFGVNNSSYPSGLPSQYVPPKTWQAFQAEIPLPVFYMYEQFGDMIHVYFIKPKGVKYLAATPKDSYLSVSAIGKDVRTRDIPLAITRSELNRFFLKDWKLSCACHPRIPSSRSQGVVSDRFIVIGDAAYSRWLKNGIESAYYTALFAAEAALEKGVSRSLLQKHYVQRCWKAFEVDNIFAKIIFYLHDVIMTNRILSYTYLSLVKKEQKNPDIHKRRLSELLWQIYSGSAPYSKIFFKGINPILQLRLLGETLILIFTGRV